ncbi:MAG: outer membrane beta-barrel protein [Flavipsychrobacter sp.]|nr:outer membrane beta-barrel protein [Flavipsychrobacter sp.]
MKKYLFIAGFSLLALGAHAQQFFVKGGLGYSAPQAGQSIDGTGTPYNGSATNNATGGGITYNYKSGASFSAGFSGTFGGGYMFNDHVGLELDVTAGLAPHHYTGNVNNQVIDSVTYNISIEQYAKTFWLLAPQIVVQTGGTLWNLYGRGGVVLPLNVHLMQEQSFTNLPGNGAVETIVNSYDNTTSFSLGLTAAIGVQYNLTDNVCLWGELNMLSMSMNLKQGTLTSETYAGQSVPLSGQNTSYPYSKNYNSALAQNSTTTPSYSIPFSNIGIHAGIMYKFDKSIHVNSHARPSHGRVTEF